VQPRHQALVVTNAAGGINLGSRSGNLNGDHRPLNLASYNPLIGPNERRARTRFPDMSHAYDPGLLRAAQEERGGDGRGLAQGVYCCCRGRRMRRREIRMLRTLGADAVGMSTVPEVIAAAHMGVRVAGISCITKPRRGIGKHAPVARRGRRDCGAGGGVFQKLLERFLPEVARS